MLSPEWVAFSHTRTRWLVGLSGGVDSTVLLHCLANIAEIKEKLVAVYFDHGLSVNSSSWLRHCEELCASLDVTLITKTLKFTQHANIEANARVARYQAFAELLSAEDGVVVGHHREDQAETVILQLMRGAGITGVAAMPLTRSLGLGVLCRPLLHQPKAALIAYAKQYNLHWINDESNLNTEFSRNYVRERVMPMLRDRWPEASGRLAAFSEHAQSVKLNLDALARIDGVTEGATLSMEIFQGLTIERQQNALRYWLQLNHLSCPSSTIIDEILTSVVAAKIDAVPCVQVGEVNVRRYQGALFLVPKVGYVDNSASANLRLHAVLESPDLFLPAGAKIRIDFRRGGEKFFWRSQTKSLKKLWQEWGVPPWMRDTVPLLYVNDVLASVIGYAISDHFYRPEVES